jgi:hypothetical protein
VIIPAWRSASTIRRALLSVAAQTVKPLEVIVIDDGSDDDTFAVAESCKGNMNGIRLIVITQENKGAGAARNVGVHAARGDWLAFLDADDEWLPTKIERSLAHAEGASLIAHDYIEVKDGRETVMDCTRHLTNTEDPFAALMLRGFIPSITVLAKRADVLAVGGFEESLPAAQDYDLWLKLLSLPQARLVMFPEALSRYSVTGTGITSQVERRRRCSLAVLTRHAPKLKRQAFQIVLKRSLIVQWEAIAAHLTRKDYVGALGTLLLAPLTLAEGLFLLYGATFTLAWGLSLFIAYHIYSKGYYADKFSSFGGFLMRRLGGS